MLKARTGGRNEELFSLHTEACHTWQQVSVQLNFCSRERSAQDFQNLILLPKQKLMKRFTAEQSSKEKWKRTRSCCRRWGLAPTEKTGQPHKFLSIYEPEPYKVVDKNGSQVLIESPAGYRYKWTIAHTKQFVLEEVLSAGREQNRCSARWHTVDDAAGITTMQTSHQHKTSTWKTEGFHRGEHLNIKHTCPCTLMQHRQGTCGQTGKHARTFCLLFSVVDWAQSTN